MEFVKVVEVSELPAGKMKMVVVDGKPVLLANVDGSTMPLPISALILEALWQMENLRETRSPVPIMALNSTLKQENVFWERRSHL